MSVLLSLFGVGLVIFALVTIHFGKYKFIGKTGETKKDKVRINVKKYV